MQLIMINPAGDSKVVGRRLADGYERAETFKFAERLQQSIQSNLSDIKVVLTRAPGEEIVPLQNASFANRLNVDLFLSIHIYHDEDLEKPKVSLIQLIFNKLSDFTRRSDGNSSVFVPVAKAHQKNIYRTKDIVNSMHSMLSRSDYQKIIDLDEVLNIPFKPLIGITAPAIGIEIGLKNDSQWELCIEPIMESLKKIIEW